MEVFRQGLLGVHVLAGFAALVLFWVPALTRKGGPWHRRAGRWYAYAMTFIAVTGVVLAVMFLAGDRWQAGLFLLFLGVITGTSLWNGWRALRTKRDPAGYTTPLHLAVALLNVGGGAALIALGLALDRPLFYAFGPVGLLVGGGMLALSRKRPDDLKFWLYQHFTGMIGSGIAAHVAFFAFGGRQLLGWGIGGPGLLLWIGPLVVGTLAIALLNVYYRRRDTAVVPAGAR